MPIYPENFVANSLSGTISVTNGFANITLPTNPFALEGDKNFVIKLRKGGVNGLVIATSPTITVRDTSQLVSLTANVSTVAEGNLVTFTLVTANAANNSNVFYSVFPVTANVNTADFVGANVGKATIIGNQATFTFFANADYSLVNETGETFRVQLRENSVTGNIIYNTSNVVITDFYKRVNVFGFVESARSIVEGTSVTFTVSAHNITTGTLLYYYTSGNADITGSNTGSVAMNSVSNTITITTASTIPANESRSFNLVLSESNLGTPLATSNTITVVDSALVYINATGGSISTAGGFRVHTFTTSDSFVINSVPALSPGSVEYLIVGGGGGGGGGSFPPPAGAPPAGYVPAPTYVPTLYVTNGSAGGGGGGGVLTGSTPVTANTYSIVVGAGGGGGQSIPFNPPNGPAAAYSPSVQGGSGSDSSALGFTSYGGGGGGWAGASPNPDGATRINGLSGGSGGGGGGSPGFSGAAGGVTVPGQGNPGGAGVISGYGGGGGGGAAEVGGAGTSTPGKGGNGGRGFFSTISGANVGYGGGGGGGSRLSVELTIPSRPLGGAGGGGDGGYRRGPGGSGIIFESATGGSAGQGGGGGGAGKNFGYVSSNSEPVPARGTVHPGAGGGSGVVIIRYPYA